jgi:hypothetical protein
MNVLYQNWKNAKQLIHIFKNVVFKNNNQLEFSIHQILTL